MALAIGGALYTHDVVNLPEMVSLAALGSALGYLVVRSSTIRSVFPILAVLQLPIGLSLLLTALAVLLDVNDDGAGVFDLACEDHVDEELESAQRFAPAADDEACVVAGDIGQGPGRPPHAGSPGQDQPVAELGYEEGGDNEDEQAIDGEELPEDGPVGCGLYTGEKRLVVKMER